jgi:hypothetical protein
VGYRKERYRKMKTTFIIEKVANMIMAVTKFDDGSTDVIWQTWHE